MPEASIRGCASWRHRKVRVTRPAASTRMALLRAFTTEHAAGGSSLSAAASALQPRRCLTLRSSGRAPAWHLAREAIQVIIRLAGQAPHRRAPLSSNVRPHENRSVTNEASLRPLREQMQIQAYTRSSEGSQAAKNMKCHLQSGASRQAVRVLERGLCFRHRLLGPPVRWRAAHRSLFSDGSKFLRTRSQPQHSGKLAE